MILVKGTRIPFRRAVSVQSALEKGSPSSPIIISFRPATPFPGFRSTSSLERRKSFLKNLQKLLHDISSVDRTSKIDLGIFRCSSTGIAMDSRKDDRSRWFDQKWTSPVRIRLRGRQSFVLTRLDR